MGCSTTSWGMRPCAMDAERCTAVFRGIRSTRRSTSMSRRRSIAGQGRREERMTESGTGPRRRDDIPAEEMDEKSDWKVVLRFFVVPLSLVAVLVSVFFGLQVLRSSRPDPAAPLGDLTRSGGVVPPRGAAPQ